MRIALLVGSPGPTSSPPHLLFPESELDLTVVFGICVLVVLP